MTSLTPSKQSGFTLIELMVVIVIVAIMASLVVMNVGGVDQRKAMQARDILLMELKKINLQSRDQARIYALTLENATDVTPFRYGVSEYRIQPSTKRDSTQSAINTSHSAWQAAEGFKVQSLPEQVFFQIERVDQDYPQANHEELTNEQSPKLIWLGNGEVKPVRIQFYFQQKELGAPIEVDHLEKISEI